MPRSQYASHAQDATSVLIGQLLRKEHEHRRGIEDNQGMITSLATRLEHGGELEKLVGDLSEFRTSVKGLTEQNVKQVRDLQAFVRAVQAVGDDENVENFQESLESTMEEEKKTIAEKSVEVTQEKMYLDICSVMGETKNNGPVDDELEVMPAGPSGINLKCPLLGSFFVNPMKNKVCGHVYSEAAIRGHLKRRRECPVFGCGNKNVQLSQLEEDRVTASLVRREKVRQNLDQQLQSQNAIDMDDDEFDE